MKILITFFAVVAVACAASVESDIPIVRQTAEVLADGYNYLYETGNGIHAEEKGTLKGEALEVVGQAGWTSPEGEKIEFSYVAGEEGYNPTGSHIHPIPEAIVRALEWIKAHPYKEPETYGKKV